MQTLENPKIFVITPLMQCDVQRHFFGMAKPIDLYFVSSLKYGRFPIE